MKRRNFLGFLGGAAVTGPGMVKEVAAKAAMDLSIGSGAVTGVVSNVPFEEFGGQPMTLLQRASSSMKLLRSLTRDQRAELKRRFGDAHRLDADLASYHSMSLGARMEMQRERNIDTYLANRRSWWQGVIDRGDDYNNDPLNDL